jgi:hypothetical protein
MAVAEHGECLGITAFGRKIEPRGTLGKQRTALGHLDHRQRELRIGIAGLRGIAVQADAGPATGPAGDHLDAAIIRITPRRIIAFGIDDTDTEPHLLQADSRDV